MMAVNHFPDVFPSLVFSKRAREFNEYNESERASIVYGWLVDGLSTRTLDDEVLKIFDRYPGIENRGWKSYGILMYLGLNGQHQGYLRGLTPIMALAAMQQLCVDEAHTTLYKYLLLYVTEKEDSEKKGDNSKIDSNEHARSQDWINRVLLNDKQEAQYESALLSLPGDKERKQIILNNQIRYFSSMTLKESVKDIYDFKCQICGDVIYREGWNKSLSRKDRWRRLSADVHHIVPLAKHGPDFRSNMICLCPTCHRKFHSGEYRLVENGKSLICKDEMLGDNIPVRTIHKIVLY